MLDPQFHDPLVNNTHVYIGGIDVVTLTVLLSRDGVQDNEVVIICRKPEV